jgi:hypothetical protein
LQNDLRSGRPMRLAELLSADADAFLPAHRGGDGTATRLYAYSWGLAYYSTFELSLLDAPTFADYVADEGDDRSPIRRFEELVGQPLAEFERNWREAMLKLR